MNDIAVVIRFFNGLIAHITVMRTVRGGVKGEARVKTIPSIVIPLNRTTLQKWQYLRLSLLFSIAKYIAMISPSICWDYTSSVPSTQ